MRSSVYGFLVLSLMPTLGLSAAPCPAVSQAETEVVKTIQQLFDAFRTENRSRLPQLLAPDFFAFDNGEQFTGDSLLEFIKQAHAAGRTLEWSVTEPRVHISCRQAWIAYVNQGSITDSAGTQPLTWLESANLQYEDHAWRIQFFHSNRAAAQRVAK